MSIAPANAYDLLDFDRMFADDARTGAYLAAIREAVRPGDVVVEIGTGTGYFAVACVQAGARHVYAIEVNPAVALGTEIAAANGVADRITFIHGFSTRVQLPERGTVLLEDLRGVLPVLWSRIPSIVDARERLLVPDARLITARDTLWGAPSRAPARIRDILEGLPDVAHGIDRRSMARRLRDDIYREQVTSDLLRAPAQSWGTIDYATVTNPELHGTMDFAIATDGPVDGVAIWFAAELFGGAVIDNSPSHPQKVYGQAFFPFTHSLDARAGDQLTVEFRAHRFGESYIFAWDTTYQPTGGAPVAFRQSTLGASLPPSLEALRRRARTHVPTVGASAALVAEVVALADGVRTLADIAAVVHARHSERFSEAEALTYVTALMAGLEDEDAELASGGTA